MIKILILMALSLNFAFAKTRFTDADKQKFMNEVKQGIAAHKVDNKGVVDLQIIKPSLYEELDIYYNQEKFTREEMIKIKQRYEEFSRNPSITPAKAEEEFYKFVEGQLEEINKTEVAKIKEGYVCNNWSCEEGLKCAPDPRQEDGKSCKKEGRECKEARDCCSGSCTMDKKSNKGYCEEVYRCFKPLSLNQACTFNPVCGEGECLAFNSKTIGIGECEERGRSCKKNSDCCSNACNGNRCVDAYICKDCVSNGKKPSRGQKCCEGLYLNESNMCVPDAPPTVIPQVRNSHPAKILNFIAALIISSANADEAYDTINADHDKYSSFRAQSAEADRVEVKAPEMKFTRKSDFVTCDIRFRDDFANYLKTSNLIDLELALLSFDYMLLGDGVNDYWTKSSDPGTSIYGRLKAVAKKHQAIRTATNEKIDKINHRLTCMCIDAVGYADFKDKDKKAFFEKECPEFQVQQTGKVCHKQIACTELEIGTPACTDGMMPTSCKDESEAGCSCAGDALGGVAGETASGIKGKRLLVNWTKNLESFNAELAIDNTEAYRGFADISNWANSEAKWNDAENKKYTLFNFHIKNPSGSVAAMGAILGALLAAGVIAILGGFASTSILTAWAAAGIIATSAVTGGTGLWLIASLKGAWISKRPEIFDKYVRSYGCGKKETCVEYSRELNQPYNNVCKVHTSANACIKNFVVYYEDTEPRYLVDPWIPKDVSKSLILRDAGDARTYAEKLEDGFQDAKANMISKNPAATGGGGKSGGAFVAENYMRTLFVDANVLGKYVPRIGQDEKRYLIDQKIIEEIKSKAKKYAIDEKFFQEGDTENLEKFADYAYQFHFIWPKTSRRKEISYPTVGLSTYLELMSNGVAGNMAVGAANAAKTFGNLNTKYLQDYLKNLQLYKDLATNQGDAARLKLLNEEIDKTKADLDNQTTFNALANNTSLDSQLMGLSTGSNSLSKLTGGKGNVNLTSTQAGLLNAIGTLRNARKAQLKKLDAYKKAMAQNGNPDRTAKVASASKSFMSKFTNPLSGSSLKGGGFGAGGASGAAEKTDAGNSQTNTGVKDYGHGGELSSLPPADSYPGENAPESSSSDKAGLGASGSGISEEDSRRLAEAVEARDKSNSDKYQSKEGQTIFEQVTNAYIRNYDKVLSKKKDKDVIEKK